MIEVFNDLEKGLIGIYLEHQRLIGKTDPKYELNENLFAINEPFYMRTEKEALIRDTIESNSKSNDKRNKRKRNKTHIYENLLSDSQKQLIIKIFNKIKLSIKQLPINSNDNRNAQQLAQMALNLINSNDYSNRLLCNDSDYSVIFDDFIIPANCSLMCADVTEGLKLMQKHYSNGLFRVTTHFTVVVDPPWDSNKSVKRKRCYQTDGNRSVLEMTKQLDLLLQLFPKQTNTRICIWTTNREKEFVLNQMLPILNCKCTHVLIWHKITRSGQSVKLRGSLEYLVIATNYLTETDCLNGILVSIPSSIHSHKPPLKELIDCLNARNSVKIGAKDTNTPVVQIVSTDSALNSVKNKSLSNSINKCITGLELYARYLNVGFHSLGFECLKLQNYKLFNLLGIHEH